MFMGHKLDVWIEVLCYWKNCRIPRKLIDSHKEKKCILTAVLTTTFKENFLENVEAVNS